MKQRKWLFSMAENRKTICKRTGTEKQPVQLVNIYTHADRLWDIHNILKPVLRFLLTPGRDMFFRFLMGEHNSTAGTSPMASVRLNPRPESGIIDSIKPAFG